MINQTALSAFKDIVGPQGFWDDPADMAPKLVEGRGKYQGRTALVLRPKSTAEVCKIMEVCAAHRIAVVPQGGNTGMVGGQIPDGSGKQIVLCLERMTAIRACDPLNNTIAVEAGLTLQQVQEAAEKAGRLFPLSLGAEGTCQIGGNLATNAGGTAVLRYGNARELCLGLEVVLADGRVLNLMTGLRKDNTGYDLKDLFIGSEGTLGIITAAVLKLFPRPQSVETLMVAVDEPANAVALLSEAQAATGGQITAFEIMPQIAVEFAVSHSDGVRAPFPASHPWIVLIEASSGADTNLRGAIETLLSQAFEQGLIRDAVRAESNAQAQGLWAVREAIPHAQKFEGGSIKHDVSVPVSAMPDFITDATRTAEALIPGVRVCAFGHIGDGNVHFNVSQPVGMETQAYLARWDEMQSAIHAVVARFGGAISAEHGIGQMKRDALGRYKDPVALGLMAGIKQSLDPLGLLNPGKVLP